MSLYAALGCHYTLRALLDAGLVVQKEGRSLDSFFGGVVVEWVSSQGPYVVLALEEQKMRLIAQPVPLNYGRRNIPRFRNQRHHLEGWVEWEGYQGHIDEEDHDRLDEKDDEGLDEEHHEGLVDWFVLYLDVGDVPVCLLDTRPQIPDLLPCRFDRPND